MFFRSPLPSNLIPIDWESAWRAVRPATGKPANSDAEISGGLKAVTLSLITANSASPPPLYHNIITEKFLFKSKKLFINEEEKIVGKNLQRDSSNLQLCLQL